MAVSLARKEGKWVAYWIYLGVFMLVIQTLLGGITRLAGAGLSITEWMPILGTIPPLSTEEWMIAFKKYQQIAQYKYLNSDYSLSDFKFIFFWEWLHRLWARLIALAFLVPLVYFLYFRMIPKWIVKPLIILFLFGVLQGLIGWIMVKSGLNDDNLYVSHIRLAIHFVCAILLIGYALVLGMALSIPSAISTPTRAYDSAIWRLLFFLFILLIFQLGYGAFMAGLKAANAASTWPSINGAFFPYQWGNALHDRITIHFIHRNLGYGIALGIVFWWWKMRKMDVSSWMKKMIALPIILVIIQVILGISAILISPTIQLNKFGWFEWIAVAHQLVGILLFLALAANLYLLRNRSNPSTVVFFKP